LFFSLRKRILFHRTLRGPDGVLRRLPSRHCAPPSWLRQPWRGGLSGLRDPVARRVRRRRVDHRRFGCLHFQQKSRRLKESPLNAAQNLGRKLCVPSVFGETIYMK